MTGYMRFVNLLIGRIGELSFKMKFQHRFAEIGCELQDRARGYKKGDFSIRKEKRRLCDLNTKFASERFDWCKERGVILNPDDCIPIALYKLLPLRKKWPLLFVFCKEFNFNERVQLILEKKIELREQIENLYLSEKVTFEDEDRLVDHIIHKIKSEITLIKNPDLITWKVISQHKAVQITKDKIVSRYYQALTTQGNMHFSYSEEMTDINVFIKELVNCQTPKDIFDLLDRLQI